MFFPIFEYSLVLYLLFDYMVMEIAYKRGLIRMWFIVIVRIMTPINMLLTSLFRMIFVADSTTDVSLHTVGFFGIQIAIMSVAVMNVLYVLMTGQGYPSHGITPEKAAFYAKWYLALNLIVDPIKIYGTFYIVFISPDGSGPDFYRLMTPFGICVGRFIDIFWSLLCVVFPAFIAFVRMKNEDPLKLEIYVPDFAPAAPADQAGERTSLVYT